MVSIDSIQVDNSGDASVRTVLLQADEESSTPRGQGVQFIAGGLQTAADGRSRITKQIRLPANALVKRYDLTITAARADLVSAAAVADLRTAEGPNGRPAVVVDFGALRTVNAILLPVRTSGYKVYPWLGMKFDTSRSGIELSATNPTRLQRNGGSDGSAAYALYAYPIAETRSERLLIETDDSGPQLGELMTKLELSLPELPADLTLRIGGGAPIWEYSGSVQPGSGDQLADNDWTNDGRRRVSIAAALAPFSGDATNPEQRTLSLELTSSIPGKLSIEVEKQELALLHRLSFNNQDLILKFPAEGRQQLLPQPPAGKGGPRTLRGLRLTLSGDLPAERVLPPVGPKAGTRAELVLGNGRAACVRLDGGQGLADITALRLPLSAGSGGAEARVVLWSDSNGGPGKVLDAAVSESVSWDGGSEDWVGFRFSKPIPFDAGSPPWAALIVSRGEATWSLLDAAADAKGFPLRLGPPQGPWRALPAVFGAATGVGAVAGRLRIAGLAPDTQPLAPLRLALGASSPLPATPSTSGRRLELKAATKPGSAQAQLVITSYTAGTVTLSEVDAITDA